MLKTFSRQKIKEYIPTTQCVISTGTHPFPSLKVLFLTDYSNIINFFIKIFKIKKVYNNLAFPSLELVLHDLYSKFFLPIHNVLNL